MHSAPLWAIPWLLTSFSLLSFPHDGAQSLPPQKSFLSHSSVIPLMLLVLPQLIPRYTNPSQKVLPREFAHWCQSPLTVAVSARPPCSALHRAHFLSPRSTCWFFSAVPLMQFKGELHAVNLNHHWHMNAITVQCLHDRSVVNLALNSPQSPHTPLAVTCGSAAQSWSRKHPLKWGNTVLYSLHDTECSKITYNIKFKFLNR